MGILFVFFTYDNQLKSHREQHGESENNLAGCIGGDSDLSTRGRQYATELGRFIEDQKIPNLRVWTSWMKRTIQTARDIDAPQERWRALNELDAVSQSFSPLTFEIARSLF